MANVIISEAAGQKALSEALGWVDANGYGAKGDGTTDDAAAINAAIAAVSDSGRVILHPGTYLIKSPITWTDRIGVILEGAGMHATVIDASADLVGLDVIQSIDSQYCSIRNMKITADAANQPDSAINAHVGDATVTPQCLTVENVFIGDSVGTDVMFAKGIKYSADTDANNDQGTFLNVVISRCTNGYVFGHINSVWHRIIGGTIGYCTNGISTVAEGANIGGGSFHCEGTCFLGNTNDILLGTRHPEHGITLSGCRSEATTGWWIDAGDIVDTDYNGPTNIFVYNSTFHGGAASKIVEYSGWGVVCFVGCEARGGTSMDITLTDAKGRLVCVGCYWYPPAYTVAGGPEMTHIFGTWFDPSVAVNSWGSIKLPTYADNAAARTGGLVTGTMYMTPTGVLMVVYTP